MLLLLKVKFLLEDVLGLTKEDGWNMPRSLAEATDGSSLAGVAWVFSSTGLESTLSTVSPCCFSELSMTVSLVGSSFLHFVARSSD